MPFVTFKFKRVNGPTRLASFNRLPKWEDLASKIVHLFSIVEEELQVFYNLKYLDNPSEETKFIVQDTETFDNPTTSALSQSGGPNLSDSSESDDGFCLFCSVFNTFEPPFSVDIGKHKTVENLKEAIKKKKEHTFHGIDYNSCNLWKLSPTIHYSELHTKLEYAQRPEEITGSIKLNPLDKLLDHFSSPHSQHIHIIVELPPNYDSEDTHTRQLRLLCERYWNRGEEGRAEIYKDGTVRVPFMTRPGTEITEGVVTRSMSSLSGGTSTRSNEGSDGELDLDSDDEMSNCTVSYESLTLGPDFDNFFGDGYSSILVRKEYRDMFEHISKLHQNGERGVVVTGMPGIGKTFFLYFMLIERILEGQCTAYQYEPTSVILLVGRDDVRIFPANVKLNPQGFPNAWALVASNVALIQPRNELTDTLSKFYLIQTAGPQPMRWEAWKNKLSAAMAVMRPWSWKELYIGGTKFHSPPLDASTLHNIFVKYGRSARHCYTLANGYANNVAQWERQIPILLTGIPDISVFEGGIAWNTLDYIASNELITIIPNSARQPCITLVSRHIAGHFFRVVLMHNHQRFWTYFNRLSSMSEGRTSARWLWGLHAIRMELSTERKRTMSLCRLTSITKHLSKPPRKKIRIKAPDAIKLPFSDVIVHGDKEALGKTLSRTIRSLSPTESTLFIPDARDQVTFDAFSISGDNLVTVFQTTIWESHPVKAKGLDLIWDALILAEDTSDAKGPVPSSARKWRLVFLIPEEVEKHWKTAQNIDFGGIKPKRQWDQYVEQFVAVLPTRIKWRLN